MKIGNFETENNVFLAPMAGVTDLPFRKICRRYGAGLVYSEMVSAKGLYYHNEKTKDMLKIAEEEHPVSLQLFGSDPAIMALGAKVMEEAGADIVDINMGCPMQKVVKNGDGSALMKNVPLAEEIISAVAAAVKIPVTVKMRLGWARVTVHGRTREDFYAGTADWREIKKVVNAVRIPVIGNGDVADGPTAKALIEETGCAAVAIGRAAWGNPWVFRAVNTYLETGEILPGPSWEERLAMARKHLHGLCVEKGERIAVREMRAHASRYFHGLPKATVLRREIMKALTEEEFGRILTGYEKELGLEEPEA